MNADPRLHLLPIALIVFGLIFLFGAYRLVNFWWPSGWRGRQINGNTSKRSSAFTRHSVYFCRLRRDRRC